MWALRRKVNNSTNLKDFRRRSRILGKRAEGEYA
jgi:hypothetical protein